MLVLSRKQAQRIRLGDSIVITVVRIGGDKVRLGIEAPKDMLVLRDELEAHTEASGNVTGYSQESGTSSGQHTLQVAG